MGDESSKFRALVLFSVGICLSLLPAALEDEQYYTTLLP